MNDSRRDHCSKHRDNRHPIKPLIIHEYPSTQINFLCIGEPIINHKRNVPSNIEQTEGQRHQSCGSLSEEQTDRKYDGEKYTRIGEKAEFVLYKLPWSETSHQQIKKAPFPGKYVSPHLKDEQS